MTKYSIAIEGLIATRCSVVTTQTMGLRDIHISRYRDGASHTWNGRGNLPDWLQRAVNAG